MKRSLIALGLLAALPFAASASELSYSYVEGGYSRISGLGDKVDGWAVNGSAALGSNFHLFGGFQSVDVSGLPVDVDRTSLGFGYNHELNRGTDLVARLSYNRYDANVSGSSFGLNVNTWAGEVGVRSQLAPSFEGYVFAGYERPTSGGGDFYGRLGAQYSFTRSFGLVADAKIADGSREYFIGPRFTF